MEPFPRSPWTPARLQHGRAVLRLPSRQPCEYKWQISDIFYWNKGNHSFKFGVDELHNYDWNNTYGGDGNGYYTYSYVGNYINDQMNFLEGKTGAAAAALLVIRLALMLLFELCANLRPPHLRDQHHDSGVFAQDNWKFSPRLTLELGVRWIRGSSARRSQSDNGHRTFTPYPGLTNNPSDKKNFGPRVGFSYDVTARATPSCAAAMASITAASTMANCSTSDSIPAARTASTTPCEGECCCAPTLPNIVAGAGAAAATPTSNFLAPNLRNPQVQEFDLMVQHDLGKAPS